MNPEVIPVEYKVYKNLFKYVNVKKFNVIEDKTNIDNKESKGPSDLKKFSKTMQFHSYVRLKATNDRKEILYIFIIKDLAFVSKVSMFTKLINTISEKKCSLIVTSSMEEIKTAIKKFIKAYGKKSIDFRYLNFNYFKIDPRNHILVDKHRLCSPEEVAKILEEYSYDEIHQFPHIYLADPQVVWVDGKVDDVIEITKRRLSGHYIKYRIVVP